jgi:hypothetical protein
LCRNRPLLEGSHRTGSPNPRSSGDRRNLDAAKRVRMRFLVRTAGETTTTATFIFSCTNSGEVNALISRCLMWIASFVWRRRESGYSGSLKTRRLLKQQNANNVKITQKADNWNVTGTRDFRAFIPSEKMGAARPAEIRTSPCHRGSPDSALNGTSSCGHLRHEVSYRQRRCSPSQFGICQGAADSRVKRFPSAAKTDTMR